MASDNDDVRDDEDDANSKDVEVVEIGTGETLDRLVHLKYLSKEERNSLVAMKFKLEKRRVLNNKRSHISEYSILEVLYDKF